MSSTAPQQRRTDTRQRIQDVALELFSEQGYEKTSLREIAERLDVTKAALYYHFKTKEDILIGIFRDLTSPMDELIAWAGEQPPSLETKAEILHRYSLLLTRAAPFIRFMQENQAAVRELSIGMDFRERLLQVLALVRNPEGSLSDDMRCVSAILAMHASMHIGVFGLRGNEVGAEERRQAALDVAIELVATAHRAAAP
ncbi:TetR/AcrR family transcriptional regulator [Streptomyces hoynatensis]|uniref:TetR/AcrR family transcriptional regulator n=1 Tax=Streptomyces hoynatensis TaxID=1141874 RepID=A0A3A9Z0F0_9ACTN|nr:TetR/AcrR family transcriptional regulator [Streptomyces hoynatensis]RKN41821.1 TetR/AcrR family transcriptional regulator [Streptomyces hoynatensis]